MDWFLDSVGHLPDDLILLIGAALAAAIGLVVAGLSRRFIFVPHGDKLEEHVKLSEIVHGSLLAFAVFVLALVLSDVRVNMGKASDAVLREASTLARLDRELELIGGRAADAERGRLRAYATQVVDHDWPALSQAEPALSAEASRTITALIVGVRAIAAERADIAAALHALLGQLDEQRQSRLESATRSVPKSFWWLIGLFLIGAMVLNGRHRLNVASASLIGLHMAAIGLVMAFILVMDEPFRGESSVSPHPIARALPEKAGG
ncbi:DUF4239 domain-containing protein [Alsobacter sp. SYSU M60028]|uniref:DUF4239 domain-containing protein n=1 Tax=Alsobacter ponti TaxID=2962936 RepID=A0ABT1LH56_9HYPH|nr:DUF4239 domain-containing protein [Alsobacter ponti]MCP8940764.1 DUF4239 domain-containing protein [Alsobacter ponti]